MKRTLLCLLVLVLSLCFLTLLSCKKEEEKRIQGVSINENGELIFTFLDGSQQNLGVVVGKDGATGATGPAGADGIDGKDGVDGEDGKDGIDGKDGVDGKDGIDGKDGVDGKDGANGKDGTNGKDGMNGADGKDGQTIVLENSDIVRVAAAKALKSSVSIATGIGKGSGIIYRMNKEAGELFILTNYHVIYDINTSEVSAKMYAYLYGMEEDAYKIPLTFVGGSMTYDLALLRVCDSDIVRNSACEAATVFDSDLVCVAERAIAIGNARGMGISVTSGIISIDSESSLMRTCDGRDLRCRLMRTDAAVNPGNSGGGLFNERGELIGIVCGAPNVSDRDGIGYAIPTSVACGVVEQIMEGYRSGTVSTPILADLGIEKLVGADAKCIFDAATQRVSFEERVVVDSVREGSLAASALEAGDVLLRIRIGDGEAVELNRVHKLHDFLLRVRVGDTVTIEYERNGVASELSIPLEETCFVSCP